MSKELSKTTEEIMNKIHSRQIKMRPRFYFILGYIISILGLIFSFITSIFFISLTRFSLRPHGPMGEYRLEQLLSTFSWWMPLLAVFGLIIGIWLLRKYDFSYKINFRLLILGLIASVLITGFVLDMTGFNDFWLYRGQQGFGQGQLRKFNSFNSQSVN